MNKINYEKGNDIDIIKRVRCDDKDALEYLLKKYSALVKKEVRTMYLIGADTEDLIQEGMIGLFKAIRDYDISSGTPFASFAKLCISRQIYTAVTASGRKKHIPLNTYISFDTPIDTNEGEYTLLEVLNTEDSDGDPVQMLVDKEKMEILRKKSKEVLSSFEQKVLELYLEGRNYDEMSVIIGKDKKSIDNGIQRIRKKLTDAISDTVN